MYVKDLTNRGRHQSGPAFFLKPDWTEGGLMTKMVVCMFDIAWNTLERSVLGLALLSSAL